jgi:hypothetical protein
MNREFRRVRALRRSPASMKAARRAEAFKAAPQIAAIDTRHRAYLMEQPDLSGRGADACSAAYLRSASRGGGAPPKAMSRALAQSRSSSHSGRPGRDSAVAGDPRSTQVRAPSLPAAITVWWTAWNQPEPAWSPDASALRAAPASRARREPQPAQPDPGLLVRRRSRCRARRSRAPVVGLEGLLSACANRRLTRLLPR